MLRLSGRLTPGRKDGSAAGWIAFFGDAQPCTQAAEAWPHKGAVFVRSTPPGPSPRHPPW
jgi:hypothetical protein